MVHYISVSMMIRMNKLLFSKEGRQFFLLFFFIFTFTKINSILVLTHLCLWFCDRKDIEMKNKRANVRKLSKEEIKEISGRRNILVVFGQSVFRCKLWPDKNKCIVDYNKGTCYVKLNDNIYFCECEGPLPQSQRRRTK